MEEKRGGRALKRRGAGAGAGAGALSDHPLFEGLTTAPGECARAGAVCMSARALAHVVEAVPEAAEVAAKLAAVPAGGGADAGASALADPAVAAAVVETAKAAVDCGTEACLVEAVLPSAAAEKELQTRFKPEGPWRGRALLSNVDIDGVLDRWAIEFPRFYHCEFAMMDFETAARFRKFRDADLLAIRARHDTFACVLNTDVSSGPGNHWVAVFVDMRGSPWTIEYFNSAGNPPPVAVTRWMEKRAAALRARAQTEVATVTSTEHQMKDTECGVYALFYIRRRLEGAPPSAFMGDRLPDDEVNAFRAHLFRDRAS
jgi:hypothetical protein